MLVIIPHGLCYTEVLVHQACGRAIHECLEFSRLWSCFLDAFGMLILLIHSSQLGGGNSNIVSFHPDFFGVS